ncbi:MAG: putative Ig domain-containing protein [Candidatus Thiodiazotropha sp. L084R]
MSFYRYLLSVVSIAMMVPSLLSATESVTIDTNLSNYCLTDLEAVTTDTEVKLIWAHSGAFSYKVYRSDDDGISFNLLTQIMSTDPSYLDSGLSSNASYQYVVKEVDNSGAAICQSPVLYLTPKLRINNKPPVFITTPSIEAITEQFYQYDADAIDLQGDVIHYSLSVSPAGMTIDSETGLVTWTPQLDQLGVYTVTVRAVDDGGMYDQQGYSLSVTEGANINQAPQIISTPIDSGEENLAYAYDVEATDADVSDILTYELTSAPSGMVVDATAGLISWLPLSGSAGEHTVVVHVVDQGGLSDSQSYSLTIAQQNLAPQIISTPQLTGTENLAYQYDVEAIDGNSGDVLSYELTNAPTGMTIDSATGLINWLPPLSSAGQHAVTVQVEDQTGLSAEQSFSLAIIMANLPPSITSTPVTTATETQTYQYDVEANDPNPGDVLSYELTNALTGMAIDSATGLINWLPPLSSAGQHAVTVRVVDQTGLSTEQNYSLTVTMANLPPSITSTPVTAATETQAYQYDVEATDPNPGDSLSYSLVVAPVGMSIDAISGLITWMPSESDIGTAQVTVRAEDQSGAGATQTYEIEVAFFNDPPTITSVAITAANEGEAYQYDVEASDPDVGDTLSYSLVAAPQGMIIHNVSGLIEWVPTTAQLGDHQVIVQVVDNDGLRSTQEYTLTVVDLNSPPVAHALSITADEDSRVDINLQGEDPDNDLMSYLLVSQPANGQLSGEIPNLSYTPNTDYNGVDSFIYRVNDGVLDSNPATVTITVNARNDAPSAQDLVIESTEDTDVSIGLAGSDPENDTLTYTILTQPARGILFGDVPSLTYRPDADFNGVDTFTYSANDGETDANSATVTITVTEVNDAPVATDANVDLPPDQISEIDLVATDVDGDPLVYSIATPTQFGAISVQGPVATYTPMPGFIGQDVFSFRVTDGQADTLATITIDVDETNRGPVITSEPAKSVTRGHAYFYAVKAEDPESDLLTYRLVTSPSGMAINQDNGLIRWLPENEGEERVELEVSDGQGNTTRQLYTIAVRPEQIDAHYTGRAFSVMFNKQQVGNIDFIGNELHLFFASASNNPSIVTVNIPGLGYSQELTVLPGGIGQLNLTDFAADLNFDELGVQSTGILVRSTEDISLTLLNFYQNSLDSALVLPDSALGTDYVITAYQSLKYAKIRSPNIHSGELNVFMGIVASQDNTDITITPTVDYFDGIAERTTGSPYTINLARGETYQVYSPSNLSGSRVSSSGPVSVFAGNSCAYIQELFCDHIVENVLPINSWGSEYYVTPLALRENGDTFVVYAAYDNTVISLNGIYIAQLNQGEYLEFIEDRPSKLTGSKPFALAQYSNSLRYDQLASSSSMGDPAMLIVEPEDHFLSSYLVSTLPETIVLEDNSYTGPFRYNFVNLLADESIKDTITLNGEPISIDWQPIENSHYYGGSLPLDIGIYDISGAGIFGLYIYGFDNYDSYAHYGGSALTTNMLPGAITLQRDGDQQLRAGDEVCAIASLTDDGGQPAVRAQAQFTLADAANSVEQNQSIVTDSAGQARACFVNPFTSTAELIVQWGNIQQSMNVEWHEYDETVNRAPLIVSYPEFYATPNQAYTYQVVAADPNDDVLSYELTQAPTGMLIDDTGLISWSVPNDFNEAVIVVQVSDGEFVVSQSYRLAVVLGLNRAPVFTSEPAFILRRSSTLSGLELMADHSYYYSVNYFDPDYDQNIIYSVLQGPAGMTIRTDGLLSWTPGNEQQGQHQVSLSIDDGFGGVNTQTFVVTVIPDHIPELAEGIPLPQIAVAQHTYSHRIYVVDQDGDSLRYSLNNPPEGMTISNTIGSQGRIRWRPTDAQIGEHSIVISISDQTNNVLEVTYPITVISNTGPILNTPDTSIEFVYNQYECFDFLVNDPDGDRVQHLMLTNPAGINFVNRNTYFRLCWQPAIEDVGHHLVEIQSTDDNGGELLTVINIQVLDEMIVQTVPGDQLLVLPNTLSTAYRARHPESLSVSYNLQNAPDGMTIDSAGNIRWQPSISDIGTYVVNAIATAGDKTANTPFNVVVRQENEAPIADQIPTQSIHARRLFEYPVQATDSNNDLLNYRLATGSPQGLTIDAQGLLRWTPADSQEGSHATSVIIEDGFGGQTLAPLNLEVVPFSNSMPVLNGPFPSRSVVGFLYGFNLNAIDPDGDPLTYSLLHTTPDGVTVDSQGTVRWTPTEEQVGASAFGVRVSDGFSYVDINWVVDVSAELMPLDIAASVSPQYIPLDGQTELAVVLNGGVNPVIDSITIDGNPLPVQAVHRYLLQGDSMG